MIEIPVVARKRGKGGLHLADFKLRDGLEFAFRSTISVDYDALGLLAVGTLVETLQAFEEEIFDSSGQCES
jgi:hypothetical protein